MQTSAGTMAPSRTMRAATMAERGGPEQIVVRDAPVPAVGPADALVEVHAAALTPSELGWTPTWTNPDGSPRTPVIPSHEVAGVVVECAADVDRELVGKRVFGLTDFYRDGAAAEYVAVRAADLAPWPDGIDAEAIAAVPLSGLTAWRALFEHGGLERGQTVLVHGAAGGVGTFVVQLAHGAHARVIAVASAADGPLLSDLGADEVIDRRSTPFEDVVHNVDLVIDTIGGDVVDRSWQILKAGGRLVSVAPSSRDIADRDPRGRFFLVAPDPEVLGRLGADLARGSIRSVVDRTFPLAEARAAYEYGIRKHPRGKVILQIR